MASDNWKIEDSKAKTAKRIAERARRNRLSRRRTVGNEFMKETEKIRVLCVDDHPIVRDGIAAIISLQPDMILAGAAGTGGGERGEICGVNPERGSVGLSFVPKGGLSLIQKKKGNIS